MKKLALLILFLFVSIKRVFSVIIENLPVSPVVSYPGDGISSGRYIVVKEYLPIKYSPRGMLPVRSISLGTWTFVISLTYLATELASYYDSVESIESLYGFLIGTIPVGTAFYSLQFITFVPFMGHINELAQGFNSTIIGYLPGYYEFSGEVTILNPYISGDFFFSSFLGVENFYNSFYVVADEIVGPITDYINYNGIVYQRIHKEVRKQSYYPYQFSMAVEEYIRYNKQDNPQAVSSQYNSFLELDTAASGIRVRPGKVYIAYFQNENNPQEVWIPVDNVEVADGKTVEEYLDDVEDVELVSDTIDVSVPDAPSDISEKQDWIQQFSQLYMKFPFSIPYDIFYIYNLILVSNNMTYYDFLNQFSWDLNFMGNVITIRLSQFYHPAYDSFLSIIRIVLTLLVVLYLLNVYRRLIW